MSTARIPVLSSEPPSRRSRGLVHLLALTLAVLLLPAFSSAASAAPVHVQSGAQEISSGTVSNLTFGQPNTSGNLIVVYVVWSNAGAVSVSDTNGNTYAPAAPVTRWNKNAWSSQVFYARNVAGGANTVRATFGNSIASFGIAYIHEYSGIDRTSPLDVSSAAIGSTSSMSSGSATTTNPRSLLFGAGASAYEVTAAGSGFTSRRSDFGNRTEDRTVTATGSYAATATQTGPDWVMHMVAFKAADDTGADTQPPSVTVTAPQGGTSVTGDVSLAASATDNVGVTGVEFLLDGTTVGDGGHNGPVFGQLG